MRKEIVQYWGLILPGSPRNIQDASQDYRWKARICVCIHPFSFWLLPAGRGGNSPLVSGCACPWTEWAPKESEKALGYEVKLRHSGCLMLHVISLRWVPVSTDLSQLLITSDLVFGCDSKAHEIFVTELTLTIHRCVLVTCYLHCVSEYSRLWQAAIHLKHLIHEVVWPELQAPLL